MGSMFNGYKSGGIINDHPGPEFVSVLSLFSSTPRHMALAACIKNGLFLVNRAGEYFFSMDDIYRFERSIIEHGKAE